ncbi:MAG: penicillin-binding protein 2 [SAR116 cluster bacterium]|nr:MAG: penicillin-binding protein 2 [SAR116 cluster bacterium]
MSQPVSITSRLRALVLPARPDPARSRRIAEVRLVISAVAVLAVFAAIAARVMFLATDDANARTAGIVPPPKAERGQILDRKGRLLATNLPITVLHADPGEIMDPAAAARALAPLLARHDVAALTRLLTKETRYVELDRKLTPARHAEILNLGIPGIHFRKSTLRAYPSGRLAAHILGQVDPDNNGLAGVEKSLDARLASGDDVTLSIDAGIQAIVAREINRQIQIFQAIGGAGVMLDIASGEVLALVSLPDFNPNHFGTTDADTRFNRATLGLYEMGSTFKVLNTAMALESKTTTLDRRYEVAKPLRVGGHRISDFHVYDWPLTVPEILVLSSNIGSARMAAEIGAETQKYYLRQLGMFDRLPIEIPETAKPLLPRSWRQSEIATISYGHGISVTPLHLAAAVATASGSGLWTAPTLLRRQSGNQSGDQSANQSGDQPVRELVFSDETTRAVRSMMRLVVKHPDGTGNYAEARGYMVGGKTGTTEKIRPEGGYYKDRNIASFAATFPVHDPRYVLVVMVDEPKGQKHSYGYATGGWVAAPAARHIIQNAAPLLGIHPVDEKAPEIRRKLRLDFKIGKEEKTLASF